MAVQVQCQNPDCLASFSSSLPGAPGACPICGTLVDPDATTGPEAGTASIAFAPRIQPRPNRQGVLHPVSDPPFNPGDIPIGTVLGERFEILSKLGKGGMGVVYLAEDGRLQRKVALKVPSSGSDDSELLRRFGNEAVIAARFGNHAQVCQVYDIGKEGDRHFIVMQYIEGRSLDRLIDEIRAMPLETTLDVLRSAATTLQAIHDDNVVHRDLKPANLMIRPTGEVVVMDFGLAIRLEAVAESGLRTGTGVFVGTLAYASPEQLKGRREFMGPGSDIYSLGVIAYELLTGQRPFRGAHAKLFKDIAGEPPEPPSRINPKIPRAVEAVVLKALEKNPADRFASMAEFADALAKAGVEAAAVRREIKPGTVLGGRYTIVRELGRGGMGAVYLAEDGRLQRKVALKIPTSSSADTQLMRRFENEAVIAARFAHNAHICQIYDTGTIDGWHFIAMQFIEGKSLDKLFGQKPVPISQAIKILDSAARTIQALHDDSVIHRDLKPSNLMLRVGGDVVLMDFGLAKRLHVGSTVSGTVVGSFLGTMAYASPEQVACDHEAMGPTSDIYSLGVIAYEMIVGHRPFRGSDLQLYAQILTEDPEPPWQHDPTVSRPVGEAILRALAKDPADRFATIAEFAEALRIASRRVEPATIPQDNRPPSTDQPKASPPTPGPGLAPASSGTSSTGRRAPFSGGGSSAWSDSERFAHVTGGLDLVAIEPGEFYMGAVDGKADERPVRKVRITRPFYLGRCPVTQEEFSRVTGKAPSFFAKRPRNPVDQASWFDAITFCNLLSRREKLPPFYTILDKSVDVSDWHAPGFRLPTEAEWEYACRGGRSSKFGCGDEVTKLQGHAWYGANAEGRTHAVGGKSPNRFGLHDMHGNVTEWCWDWYDPTYYAKGEDVDPHGPELGRRFRVMRGGSWRDAATAVRSSERSWSGPTVELRHIGFRVARSIG